MKSWRTTAFRAAFRALPKAVQRQAHQAYKRFAADPTHPSLQFKRVHSRRPIYSVRISRGYRAIGTKSGEDMVWFWIGSHAEYDRLIG